MSCALAMEATAMVSVRRKSRHLEPPSGLRRPRPRWHPARDLPVEAINRPGLAINLNTAKAIGIDIPPLLLTRADDVIDEGVSASMTSLSHLIDLTLVIRA